MITPALVVIKPAVASGYEWVSRRYMLERCPALHVRAVPVSWQSTFEAVGGERRRRRLNMHAYGHSAAR